MITSKKVTINGLTKIYSQTNKHHVIAVNNVDLAIEPGEFITLLGPSGCGKTTVLRMIAGFEIPNSGTIAIGEEVVNNLTPDKRDTAMVFQSYALFPHLNVFDNVAFGLQLRKLPKNQIEDKVLAILKLVGLENMHQRAANQLSGGQQQRVALARALVMEPAVLLFDEPLSNLDAKLRVYMRYEIRRIQQKLGITTIYVTHDQSEAMSMSDRIVVMNKGEIEQIGIPQEIYRKPSSAFVADFIGIANILPVKLLESTTTTQKIILLDTELLIPYNPQLDMQAPKIVLRPEAITLVKSNNEKAILTAEVISSVFMGDNQEYLLKISDQKLQVIQSDPEPEKIFSAGALVGLYFSLDKLHFIDK